MSDSTTSVIELRNKIQTFIDDRDWAKYHNPKDISISIAIEASELMELFQWVKDSEVDSIAEEKRAKIEEELADVMIYCFSLANTLNIDVATAVLNKVEKNQRKYPSDRVKGDYKKYSELEGG